LTAFKNLSSTGVGLLVITPSASSIIFNNSFFGSLEASTNSISSASFRILNPIS
jgi:hypothetical protein